MSEQAEWWRNLLKMVKDLNENEFIQDFCRDKHPIVCSNYNNIQKTIKILFDEFKEKYPNNWQERFDISEEAIDFYQKVIDTKTKPIKKNKNYTKVPHSFLINASNDLTPTEFKYLLCCTIYSDFSDSPKRGQFWSLNKTLDNAAGVNENTGKKIRKSLIEKGYIINMYQKNGGSMLRCINWTAWKEKSQS